MPTPDRVVADPTAAFLFGANRVDVQEVESHVERPGVVAAVVGCSGSVGVGQLLGPDEVPPSHLGRVEPRRRSELIDRPLDGEGGLGPARSPIRAGWGKVGYHPADLHRHLLDVVEALGDERGEMGDVGTGVGIRTEVGEDLDAGPPDPPVGLPFQRDPVGLAPPVSAALEVLPTLLDPDHRPLVFHGGRRHQDVFGEERPLHAEGASYVGDHNPDRGGIQTKLGGELSAETVGCLMAAIDGEVTGVGGLDPDHQTFDGRRGDTLVVNGHRGGEWELTVGDLRARRPFKHQVALVEERHGVTGGASRVGHRLERLDVGPDHVGGIDSLGLGPGNDHGDRLADIANLADGEEGTLETPFPGVHPAPDGRKTQVSSDVDRDHTRHPGGGLGLDVTEHAMGNGAPIEMGMEVVGCDQVGHVTPCAGEEAMILETAPCPEIVCVHGEAR
jgi:hypothetical protein